MKKSFFILLFCISFIIGCRKTDGETSINKDVVQMKNINSQEIQDHEKNENVNPENSSTENGNYEIYSGFWTEGGRTGVYHLERVDEVGEKEEPEAEISKRDLQNTVYERYYSPWSENNMLVAIEERSQYLERCPFYKDVLVYMENTREVKDIACVVEPLYYTDMKYYKSQDFENVPLLIIHLAKNEIYARHGYIFRNEDLNNYFMGQLWYETSYTQEVFDDSVFNEYEKSNLKLLVDMDLYN